jgi:hypothetical protein
MLMQWEILISRDTPILMPVCLDSCLTLKSNARFRCLELLKVRASYDDYRASTILTNPTPSFPLEALNLNTTHNSSW